MWWTRLSLEHWIHLCYLQAHTYFCLSILLTHNALHLFICLSQQRDSIPLQNLHSWGTQHVALGTVSGIHLLGYNSKNRFSQCVLTKSKHYLSAGCYGKMLSIKVTYGMFIFKSLKLRAKVWFSASLKKWRCCILGKHVKNYYDRFTHR